MAIVKNNFQVSRLESGDFLAASRDCVLSDDGDDDELRTRCSTSESESDYESDSDVDSGAASDDFDVSELGEKGTEFIQSGGQGLSIPLDLYDLPDLCEILSVDTWNNCLSEEERFSLAEFLPDMDQQTFVWTLTELFSGSNIHFGNPLMELYNRLKGGLCEPRVALYQQGLKFLEKRRHYHLLRKYQNSMVSSLFQIRKAWEECPGYSIEKRLRLLSTVKTQSSLRFKNGEGFGSETDLSEKEETSESFRNKKLKDLRFSAYAQEPSLILEGAVFGKSDPKGLLKSGTLKPYSKNLSDVNGSFDIKSRPSISQLVLPRQYQATGCELGTACRSSRSPFVHDDNAVGLVYDMGLGNSRKLEQVKWLNSGKKQVYLKEETDNHMNFPFSVKSETLYPHVKKNKPKKIVDEKIFSGQTVNARCSDDYYPLHAHKKVTYEGKLQRSMVDDWMDPGKVKGNQVDRSSGTQSYSQSKTQEAPFSMDDTVENDDNTVKSKKWKAREDFRSAKNIMGPGSKFRSYNTSFSPQRGNSDVHYNHKTKMPRDKITKKDAHNGRMGMEDVKYGTGSPFSRSEETESDPSQQLDEDGNFISSEMKLVHRSGVCSFKERHDLKKVSKPVRNDKMQYGQGLDKQLCTAEIEIFTSNGKQKGKINEISYYANGSTAQKYYPTSAKLGDGHNQTDSGMNCQIYHDPGERSHPSVPKMHSAEKKRRRKVDLEYSAPHSTPHSTYMEGGDLHITHKLVDDRVQSKRLAKFQNPKADETEAEQLEKLKVPLFACNSTDQKRRGMVCTTDLDNPDESDHLQFSSQQLIADTNFTKKKGKKKLEAETGRVALAAIDSIISEREGGIEPETKPLKKPFPLITPTVHTGFSFSIVHLLSAVRVAMITSSTEDILEKCDGRLKPKLEFANAILPSHVYWEENASSAGQESEKNLPSLTVQEIVNRVRSNPQDPCILEIQEPLQDLVRGVLRIFSSKTAPLGAKGWKTLILYEKATKSWSWVGPFPSSSSDNNIALEETSAATWGIPHKMLVKLVDAFANWLKSGQETLQQIGSLPPPPTTLIPQLDEKERFRDLKSQKSPATISTSTDEVRAYFWREEFLRYSVPDRAFSYTAADGRKSTVAPLKRCSGKSTSKARDHFMLKPNRPAHVTILCIVRDAAARLPGNIGTRADVCTLIRDSQYIVDDVSDAQVNQVVSGALDRLHYERDPCVKFDMERKLWAYLHRDREEEDFEDDGTSSTKKWKKPRKDVTEQTDTEPGNDMGYQGMMDQVAGGSSNGYQNEFNAEPSASSARVKAEPVDVDLRPNMEQLLDSSLGNMCQEHPMDWEALDLNQLQEKKILCLENSANDDFEDDRFCRERPGHWPPNTHLMTAIGGSCFQDSLLRFMLFLGLRSFDRLLFSQGLANQIWPVLCSPSLSNLIAESLHDSLFGRLCSDRCSWLCPPTWIWRH